MRPATQINLASEPFRRDRALLAASAALAVALVGVLAMQLFLITVEADEGADSTARIEGARDELGALASEEARLRATLSEPDNEAALERSLFLNSLLMRKGISWTLIFRDLEEVMPYNVKLVEIRPQLRMSDADSMRHEILLEMVVAAQSVESVVEMLMALEDSPLFGGATPATALPPTDSEPLYRYQVNVRYEREL